MKKICEFCQVEMVRPRWSNGNLDSAWKTRRFCSSRCYGDWILAQKKGKPASGRKIAQKRFPLKQCERCKSTVRLQRHHKDRNSLNNKADNVEVLCQTCHKNLHMAEGSWSRGLKKTKLCAICEREFLPHHSKNHKTCSRSCLSELGRRNALKRWRIGSIDLEA